MPKKNKLINLNDHLFEQLERLNDDELKGDDLKKEVARGKAMSGIAKDIANNARIELEARKLVWEWNKDKGDLPPLLEAN